MLAAVVLSPLAALYGIVVLVRGLVRAGHRLRGARRALDATILCPNGHTNQTTGRWECAHCRATYIGWVGRCTICGAGAGWTPCVTCGVGISFPWARS